MYKYIGIKKFAGISKGDVELTIPTLINEVYSFAELPDIDKWKIVNTPLEENKKITWHEIQYDKKTIFICDRVLVNNMCSESIYIYSNGIRVEIDGVDYICRLINSGSSYEDKYDGAIDKDEWDNIIGNSKNIIGLPDTLNNYVKCYDYKSDETSTHNISWNWMNIGTITNKENGNNRIIRGNYSSNFIYEMDKNSVSLDIGWRPVLEKVIQEPIIEGDSGRLGVFEKPFKYTYLLKTYDEDDYTLDTVIKLDGSIIDQEKKASNIEQQVDMGEYWNGLYRGRHTLEIKVVNSKGLEANNVVSFTTPTAKFVDKDALNYFAQELWNSKIKTFVADFSKRQGGLILDANESFTGDGQVIMDSYSDCNKAIETTINTTSKTVAKFSTDTIKLGKHGLVLRGAVGNRVDIDVIEVIVSVMVNGTNTELVKKRFKGSQFKEVNKYSSLYMSFD